MFQLLLAIIYLAFISLGLPDALLGSAWPIMYQEFCVPVSYMGIISMIIAAGTVVSSLMSDRTQCASYRDRTLWFLHQQFHVDALFVGNSLWTRCRKRRCRTQ